jgi:hypothetical protein
MTCATANTQSASRHSCGCRSLKTQFSRNECLPLRQFPHTRKTKVQFIVPLHRRFAQHNVASNHANPHFPRDPRRNRRYRIGIAVFTA